MSIKLFDREIDKILVIDDDSDSRESYGLTVEEIEVDTVLQKDRVSDIDIFLKGLGRKDAIISDHHLKKKGSYFPSNGAEFMAQCYDRQIPSVLVTKYEMASYHEIRPYKNKIPVVLTPEQFNPDSLIKGLLECVNEFKGNVSPTRKTWKTLVRFDDVDDHFAMAIIPAWNRNIVINLNKRELPEEVQSVAKPDMRLFAHVNIEAEDAFELFFSKWELLK